MVPRRGTVSHGTIKGTNIYFGNDNTLYDKEVSSGTKLTERALREALYATIAKEL